ncbi:FecCD family ABC transporter permease [Synergistes jonesii]|uniref:FecCD family ABC transporter permease n=1 Tax=Synergistes jonesii TaxID=2754 RepID=UPI00248DB117|nr:iron ABC transporter permease [Synergistes jonesii]
MTDAEELSRHRGKLSGKRLRLAALLCLLLFISALWRLGAGEWDIPAARVAALLNPLLDESMGASPEALVVRSIRLPRFFAAVGCGGLLAVSGAVLQGLLTNALAEPYTLGIAAGAAFGGALGFFLDSYAVVPMAFLGAMSSLWLVSLIAARSGGGASSIVLAGVVMNAILSAGVTFLKAIADDRLGAIVLWLMGSLSGASPSAAVIVWCSSLILFVPAFVCARQIDACSLSEGQGELLGVEEKKLRALLLAVSSLATAAVVSFFGIIGFVGLVVPHLTRSFIGPSTRPLLVFCFLGGGLLLALADGAAQAMGELPVGVITALIGGPFFCWILIRGKAGA